MYGHPLGLQNVPGGLKHQGQDQDEDAKQYAHGFSFRGGALSPWFREPAVLLKQFYGW